MWSFRSVGRKCPFPFDKVVVPSIALLYSDKNNNQMRGDLGGVCATDMYRTIGHVKFSKFQTEILLNGKRPRSKLHVPDMYDVKQKTSLFSGQGKICLVLFHGFCSFVLRDLCPVIEVNTKVYDQWS